MGWKLTYTKEVGPHILTDDELEAIRRFLSVSSFLKHVHAYHKVNHAILERDMQTWENEGGKVQ